MPTEVITDNPYGLEAALEQGGAIALTTFTILVLMSVATWYILFTKLWDQHKIAKQRDSVRKFWESPNLRDGVTALEKNGAYRQVLEDGLRAADHHEGGLIDKIDAHEWLTMSLQRSVQDVNSRLQSGLAFLATTGSTAPFIGLFGTVIGIYRALINIGVAGQASIDKVAGPVGEALIMTALGLAVAVPAVMAYNYLLRRNKAITEGLNNFASDVHAVLISGSRMGSTPPTQR